MGQPRSHGLARGDYSVQVLNAKGLKQNIPVALSRSQTIDINVPTNLDLLVVAGLGLLVALSLIVFGRLQPLRSRTRNDRPAAHQDPQNALVKSDELLPVEEKVAVTRDEIIKWS